MFALIIAAVGAAYGLGLLLAAGLPVVGLRFFNLLPFDRRIWWSFAAAVAYFAVRHAILKSYNFQPPTSAPENFFFEAHISGGQLGVIGGYLVGLAILFQFGHPDREQSLNFWLAIPLSIAVLGVGVTVLAKSSIP